jgi:hypothetical protein
MPETPLGKGVVSSSALWSPVVAGAQIRPPCILRELTGGASPVSSLHPRATAHAGAALPPASMDALH